MLPEHVISELFDIEAGERNPVPTLGLWTRVRVQPSLCVIRVDVLDHRIAGLEHLGAARLVTLVDLGAIVQDLALSDISM